VKRSGLITLLLSTVALASVTKGQRAPDFNLPSLKGASVSLASLRGKVVVLDFWAQWCEPCKQELPELQKLSQAYAGKNVVFVGVNVDKQRENAEKLARQLGLTFPILLDPSGGVAGTYDLPKMPTSFLIDRKGLVRFVHEGYDGAKDVARFKTELDELTR
jgi:peroxiredoxin